MDDWDPIARHRCEMAEVFAHAPTEFEITPWNLVWESPCWVCADINLRPNTPATRDKFFASLSMPHKVDAFARVAWEGQLWAAISPRLAQLTGPHANDWWTVLMDCHKELKEGLKQTDSIFQQPFRFVRRQEFATVDLATILKESPENMSVYLALEKGSYCEYMFLRIHSSPPFIGDKPRCLWYEKRLPDSLHTEDVLPWVVATFRRLPKKHRPPNVEPWTKRLLHFETQLAQPANGIDKAWIENPKITLVLGPTSKVGYRSLTHFERRDISHVIRQDEIVTVEGNERYGSGETTFEIERTFHLLALDSTAAERVERQIISGEKVHFGLDGDILGIICCSGHVINAINAPMETIRRLCVAPGLDLRPVGGPRHKLKCYELCKPGEAV